jgi:hypothetical protein
MKSDYDEHLSAFYDRGIPDLVGYVHLFGLEPPRVDEIHGPSRPTSASAEALST